MYQWLKGTAYTNIATMNLNCITLNNCAAIYFADVRWVLVGLDEENLSIAIKPVTKDEFDKRLYPLEDLHKISVGTGYARISNRFIMSEISRLIDEPLNNQKYLARFDEGERMLIIDLNQPA